MKTLIIGAGEVGSALKEIVGHYHNTYLRDLDPFFLPDVEVLHICYPDSKNFVEQTKSYIREYQPILTVINSSVKVGTTLRCGKDVVYSPIRGRHPNLVEEMKIFVKFVGGYNKHKVYMAKQYFEECGWQTAVVRNPDSIEYLKLMSNVHMGLEIAWRQEVERMMKKFRIDSKDYGLWELSYAEGYKKLAQFHLMRSFMKPSPIGGHCILPCTQILKSQYESKAFDFILASNSKAKKCLTHES